MSDYDKPVTESELIAESNGLRVTLDDVEGFIAGEVFFTALDGMLGARVNEVRREDEFKPVQVQALKHDQTPEDGPLALLTFCVLVLKNGYTVHGTSAAADPVNFNAEIGKRIARENAVRQIWPLLGFQLRSRIANRLAP